MKTLQLRCKPLDTLLGSGIQSGIITKIYGEGATGKTNLCLQAARECAAIGYTVAYIDTEGVSIERLRQICVDYNFNKIMNNILFFHPTSFNEQEQKIKEATTKKNIGLIIIDTINSLYRIQLETNRQSAMRSFTRQMTNLQVAAREKDLYVLVVEQVYTDQQGQIKPFTHKDKEHMIKTVIKLEKFGNGERLATLMKHPSRPVGTNTRFHISAVCLE